MLPRFLKTFLFVLLLIVIPTLVLLYRNHPAGSNWNEWSLERGTSDSAWNPLSASGDDDDGLSPLHLEDHWNAGGAEPDYRYAKVVEAEKENIGTGTGGSKTMTVYRLGDTLVNQEELEAFRTWRQTYLSEGGAAKSADEDDLTRKDGEDRPILASAWSSDAAVQGGVIMPKLGNATAKAELGRASWKLLHLITMRFPEKPTEDERAALKSYFYLFSRLYPCGECAHEFQQLLKEYPPQTSSRKTASLWLCSVHNLVNARLGKPDFDCLTLDATYDCGCADDEIDGVGSSKA